MGVVLALLIAGALALTQLAAAAAPSAWASAVWAPARGDVAGTIVRAAACVDLELGVRAALLCPAPDELTALERRARELKRAARGPWRGDLEHFEAFCRTLTLDTGAPFRLQPFQRTILRDYFNGARETLVLLPKKNGKTTLMAALVVYHLVYIDEARCYVAASSRDQATILYDHAKGFVTRSVALQRRVLVRGGTRELRSKRDSGFVKVLAADSETADGVGPTLAIVDELHRHKSTALYDVFRDGLDARDGAMLTITTAGDDEDSPLGLMRSNFLALPGKRVRGRYTYCRSRDRSNVMHEWALRATDNLNDLDLVKSVNPLASQTKAKLKRRRDSTSMTTQAWARFACNVWTQGEDAAIATLDWARKSRPGLRIPADDESDVVVGIDLGWTNDTSGLVPVGHAPGNRDEALIDERLVIVPAGTQPGPGPRVRLPDWLDGHPHRDELQRLANVHPGKVEDGVRTSEEVIKGALIRLWLIWPGMRWAIDPNAGGMHVAQWIEAELADGDEDRIWTYSQQPAPMAIASMHFAAGVGTRVVQEPPPAEDGEEGEPRTVPVWHPDHEELNRHIRGAVARWVGERWRFDKRKKPTTGSTKVRVRPIDATIAATLGYRALMAPPPEELVPFALT
jgi:Phage Terminase